MNLAKESPSATPNIVMNMQLISHGYAVTVVLGMELPLARFLQNTAYVVLGRNIFAAAPETSFRGIRRCIKTIAFPAV